MPILAYSFVQVSGREQNLYPRWVRVAMWYKHGPQSSSYVLTSGLMYVSYRCLDSLGPILTAVHGSLICPPCKCIARPHTNLNTGKTPQNMLVPVWFQEHELGGLWVP